MQNFKKSCGLIPYSCKSNLCQTKYRSRNRIDFPRRGRSRTPNVLHCILCTYRLSTAVESEGSGSFKGIDPALTSIMLNHVPADWVPVERERPGICKGIDHATTSIILNHVPQTEYQLRVKGLGAASAWTAITSIMFNCICRLSTSWEWRPGNDIDPAITSIMLNCTCRLSSNWEWRVGEQQAHRLL